MNGWKDGEMDGWIDTWTINVYIYRKINRYVNSSTDKMIVRKLDG